MIQNEPPTTAYITSKRSTAKKNMKTTIVCYLLVLSVSIFIQFRSRHSSICLPRNHSALFIFGDSLFDSGNNNYINSAAFSRANFPPYGETFFKYPSGRFSDGRVIPDFIAAYAKLPLVLPYLHPGNHKYIYGVNFASGGAGALVETGQGTTIDLKTQASYFKEVSIILRQKLGDAEAKSLLSKSVNLFSIGGNDYAVPFLNNLNPVLPYSNEQFVNLIIGNISTAIQETYKVGGRKFAFVNVGPLNCFPLLRMAASGSLSDCLKAEGSELARLHNIALLKMLQQLETKLKGLKYMVFDFNSALAEVMKFPSKYGFKEGEAACCGGGPYRGYYSCGGKRGIKEYELCENVSEYVFYDGAHPTEKAHQHFAQLLWSGNTDITKPYNLKHLFAI